MRAEKKVIEGIIPVTTTNAVYIDGTNKTLDETLNKYVIEENKNEQINIWIGTQEEYDAILNKKETTIYFIKNTNDTCNTLFRRDENGIILSDNYQLSKNCDFNTGIINDWTIIRSNGLIAGKFDYNPDNVKIEDRKLTISINNNNNGTWTTGNMRSNFSTKCGIVEYKVKFPDVNGYLIALFADVSECNNYPKGYAEVDVTNHTVGEGYHWSGVCHYDGKAENNNFAEQWEATEFTDYDNYHIIGVIYTEDSMKFYIDDVVVNEYDIRLGDVGGENGLIENLNWYLRIIPTDSCNTESPDAKLYVDWFRVYNNIS